MTRSQVAAISLILLGIAVLAVSSIITLLLPTSSFWTEEQAREQSAAAARLHQVLHESGHTQISQTASTADKLQAQQELDAARARYQQSKAALEKAQFWRRTVPSVLRWTAGGLSLIGVLIYLSTKGMND
jgi:hypothetical protein